MPPLHAGIVLLAASLALATPAAAVQRLAPPGPIAAAADKGGGGASSRGRSAPQRAEGGRTAAATAAVGAGPYVIAGVFCGRAERMRLLLPYLDRLRSLGQLHEVHLWDFVKHQEDRDWLHGAADAYDFQVLDWSRVGTPPGVGWTFARFYEYYADPPTQLPGVDGNATVVLKMDDDIVYVDTAAFPAFVRFAWDHPEYLIVHANVVNNPVTAYYQFRRPALAGDPLAPRLAEYPANAGSLELGPQPARFHSPLFDSAGELAIQLHERFLEQPDRFRWGGDDNSSCIAFQAPTLDFQGRFNINFFAARQAAWVTLARLAREGEARGVIDEVAVTVRATRRSHKECFFAPFNVAHLAFVYQAGAVSVLPLYEHLLAAQGLVALEGPDNPCVGGVYRVDHPGDNLPGMPVRGVGAAACEAQCREAAGCAGYAFRSAAGNRTEDECWLKHDARPTGNRDPHWCIKVMARASVAGA